MKRHAEIRGTTLTELLVVLAIISLLATVLLPVYVNRMEQARIATAKQEVREIAHALDQCLAIHGFYVPIHVLDDLNPNVDVPALSNVNFDTLANSAQSPGGIFLIDPNRDLQPQVSSVGLPNGQLQISNRNVIPRIETMYQNWAGPFLEFRRYHKPNPNPDIIPSSADVRQDYPLDPWGQPYRFYSPFGIIGQGAHLLSNWPDGAFNGRLQQDGLSFFDRFAIVSFGPDGLTEGIGGGTRNHRRDDIVYLFGGLFSNSSFRQFY